MTRVNIIGGYSTSFGKKPDAGYKTLTEEAYLGVLADAGLSNGDAIDFAWFGNCTMESQGQTVTRGQVCFAPLVERGLFPQRIPIANVENACATSSTAFYAACREIQSGESDLVLVLGVEKLYHPDKSKSLGIFSGGIDQLDSARWHAYFTAAGAASGKPFELADNRSIFMDTYAMQACYHMKKYGTTQRQLAIAAAKTHNFGTANEKAYYRRTATPDQILEDREVSYPLTRAMCAPICDGAAALLLCSERFLQDCERRTRERAVQVRACAMSGGKYRDFDEPGLSAVAAQRAYTKAGITPFDIDVAEVHDATSFSEIYQAEMLGFCDYGKGGQFIEEGGGHLEGKTPLNTSGGLIAKGHPVGATGASQIHELCLQLRGEAGERQVANAGLALAENGGGVMGFDEAVCVVSILERR